MVLGDVFAVLVPVVSCGDSAIIWPYTIQSLEEKVIESFYGEMSWYDQQFALVLLTLFA
jgi:hypothetical protein